MAMRGIEHAPEIMVHPCCHGVEMKDTFRLDFVCRGSIIIECKSVTDLNGYHRAQLFNYLHLTKYPCGILVNLMPRFAQIERYFYDKDIDETMTTKGEPLTRVH